MGEMQLPAQEQARINILRAVREEVEGGHHHHAIQHELAVLAQDLPGGDTRTRLELLEGRAFLDPEIDEEHQQRRRRADEEHAAPAEIMIGEANSRVARK